MITLASALSFALANSLVARAGNIPLSRCTDAACSGGIARRGRKFPAFEYLLFSYISSRIIFTISARRPIWRSLE